MFVVFGTPIPMKLKKASKKMALGTVNIEVTTIAPNVFGKICLKIKLNLDAPNVLEAITNSWFLILRIHHEQPYSFLTNL